MCVERISQAIQPKHHSPDCSYVVTWSISTQFWVLAVCHVHRQDKPLRKHLRRSNRTCSGIPEYSFDCYYIYKEVSNNSCYTISFDCLQCHNNITESRMMQLRVCEPCEGQSSIVFGATWWSRWLREQTMCRKQETDQTHSRSTFSSLYWSESACSTSSRITSRCGFLERVS